VQEHSLTKELDEQLRQAAAVVDHWREHLVYAQVFHAPKAASFNSWQLGMAVEALSALKSKRLQLEAEAGEVRSLGLRDGNSARQACMPH
jgi:hypothetical protein